MRHVIDEDPYLNFFAEFNSKELGDNAFDKIVAFGASYFKVEYVHIALLQNDRQTLKVSAGFLDGRHIEPGYTYLLEGTPCQYVINTAPICFEEHIQELFPKDEDLITLQAEGYIGEPIVDNNGNTVGLIVLISRRKLESSDLIASLMKMLAGRSGIELARQKVESSLRKEHETLQLILDYAPIGIWLQNGKGKIEFVNKAFTEAVGIPEESFLSVEHYMELIPDEFKPQCVASDEKALTSDGVSVTLQQLPFVDGKIHDLKVIKAVKYDDEGNPIALVGLSLDITDELQKQTQLLENQLLLQTVIDEMPNILVLKDENGNFLLGNQSVAKLYNTTPDQMIGKHDDDFGVPKEIADGFRANVLRIMTEGETHTVIEQSRDAQSGELRHFRSIKKPFKDQNGNNRILVIATDITDIIESQKKVEESEHLLQEVMSIAKEGIWDWHIPSGKLNHNREWYEALMLDPTKRIESLETFTNLIHPDDKERVWNQIEAAIHGENPYYSSEHRLIRSDGQEIWVQDRGQIIERDANGAPLRMVGAFTDITNQVIYQKQLEHIAHYDPLTGLPNRILNAERLQQAMFHAKKSGTSIAVLFLDIDGFKPINDQYGHEMGDNLLNAIARRIEKQLRNEDILSRSGGDEFIAILGDLPSNSYAGTIIERILESFNSSFMLQDKVFHITASIGVTFYPQKEEVDGDQLIRQADLAMYAAKQSGKHRYHIFDADHDHTIRTHHKMVQKIKEALLHKEFELYYQPKINMKTGELLGAEALIRWNHPSEGIIYPNQFLPCIEDETLAIEIGEWVIHTALDQLCRFHKRGFKIALSVNVGALQLLSGTFSNRLKTILSEHPDADPTYLEIEILETSALEDLESALLVMKECITLGVKFSLDDFGTGYSSLSYLKKLPISTLKIDQSFVRDIITDPDDHTIVKGIISLGRAFGKHLIAEGVETEQIGEKLIELGCEDAQGYWIAKPMESERFYRWIDERENSGR